MFSYYQMRLPTTGIEWRDGYVAHRWFDLSKALSAYEKEMNRQADKWAHRNDDQRFWGYKYRDDFYATLEQVHFGVGPDGEVVETCERIYKFYGEDWNPELSLDGNVKVWKQKLEDEKQKRLERLNKN